MKKLLIILCLFTLVCGCGKVDNKNEKDVHEMVQEVIKGGNYEIVDVRTKEEFDEGHVVGAKNIPYDEIDENVSLDKTKTILVYCRSGRRSGIAKDTLTNLGYTVIDLGSFESLDLDKE